MKTVVVYGWDCPDCKHLYLNILHALELEHVEAEVKLVSTAEELVKHNVFSIPTVEVDGKVKLKGRGAELLELRELLLN